MLLSAATAENSAALHASFPGQERCLQLMMDIFVLNQLFPNQFHWHYGTVPV